jgi:hypothetical protein
LLGFGRAPCLSLIPQSSYKLYIYIILLILRIFR